MDPDIACRQKLASLKRMFDAGYMDEGEFAGAKKECITKFLDAPPAVPAPTTSAPLVASNNSLSQVAAPLQTRTDEALSGRGGALEQLRPQGARKH